MSEEKQAASAKATARQEELKKQLEECQKLKDYNPSSAHTPPPIDELKKELEKCQREKEEFLAGWQRARAEFLNYKKEELERIGDLLKYAGEGLILKFLPILDNFEIAARQNFPSENLSGQEKEKINQVIQGFLQIKTQIEDFLKSQGVEEIKTIGEKFDPNFHEVVEEINKEGVEPGIIVEEIQKGYKINGRLLRPAKVKVTK